MAMRKRQQHQRKLAALAEQTGASDHVDVDAEAWRDALPHLCAALDRLGDLEREILLARFFSGNSFKEIAQRFGKSEAACKMRVKRSLEKLNTWMSQRGISLSAGAIAAGLGSEWAKAAPPGFDATLPAAAICAAPGITAAKILSNSLATMDRLAKVGLLTASVAVFLGIYLVHHRSSDADQSPVGSRPSTREKAFVRLRSALILKPRADDPLVPAAGNRDAIEVAAVDDQLAKFWLPSVEVAGMTAQQALDHLRGQFQSLGGDRSLVFEYEVPADEETFPVNLSLGNVTVLAALRHISVEAGVAIDFRQGGVAMVALPVAGTEIATQRFPVPPDFLSLLASEDGHDLGTGFRDGHTT